MAIKFDWRRILINSGLSALAILMDELSKNLAPDPKPLVREATIEAIGPDGWPNELGLGSRVDSKHCP
jgi:hypothetical protein